VLGDEPGAEAELDPSQERAYRNALLAIDLHAAELLRDDLRELRGQPAPQDAIATAAEGLRRAVEDGAPVVTWLLEAAALDEDLTRGFDGEPFPDEELLTELAAGSISPIGGEPPVDLDPLERLSSPAWVRVLSGLLDPDGEMDVDAGQFAELAAGELRSDVDLDQLTEAHRWVIAAWRSLGVVDAEGRVTEAGRWVLPRAACYAWDSDFDDPDEHELPPTGPAEYREPLHEEPPEFDPLELELVDGAREVLAEVGALTLYDLADRLSRGAEDVDVELLNELLWEAPRMTRTSDGRVVDLHALAEGSIFTHVLDEREVDTGRVALGPDLAAFLLLIPPEMELADGGAVRYLHRAPFQVMTSAPPSVLEGPAGWLDGCSPGDLVGLRIADGRLHVEVVDTVDEKASERTAGHLEETFEMLGETRVRPGVIDLPELLIEVLVHAPRAFSVPVEPLGELFDRTWLLLDHDTLGVLDPDAPVDDGADEEERREQLATIYRLDDEGVDRVLDGLDLIEEVHEGHDPEELEDDIAALTIGFEDAGVAHAVVRETLNITGAHAEPLALVVQQILGGRPRGTPAAGCHWALAACAEFEGRTEDGEGHVQDAIAADPDFGPALDDAAWFAEDRGDAAKALQYLRRLGVDADDPQRERLERFARPARTDVGRNDPCPCGSGRKFKVCCLPRGGHPLHERANWLLDKAGAYVHRPPQRIELLAVAENLAGPDGGGEAMIEVLRQPLTAQLTLFEEELLEDFLDVRGALLPADELELGRSWVGTPLGLYEVADVRRDEGLTLLDLRSGESYEVAERLGTRSLRRGEALLARLLPDGRSHRLAGGGIHIRVHQRERVLELLDAEPDAEDIAGLLAWLSAPPKLVTMEKEPTVFCTARFHLDDAEAALATLAERFEEGPDGSVTEFVEVEGQSWSRGVIRVEDGDLLIETNSVERLNRWRRAIEEAAPDAVLVDETRRTPEEMPRSGLPSAPPVDPADVPPELLEALEEQMREREERWVDESIPLLGGLTPREALADPTRRDQLLALLDEWTIPTSGPSMDPDRIRRLLGID
jgi:hypothetical protein